MTLLIITAKYPPALCGVGDHSAGLRHYLQQQGHHVVVATASGEAMHEAVYRYPEKGRAAFLKNLVAKENITHVLWQYSPYAMHPRGTPWWVLGAMRALRKTGVQQAVYFHEVQIRYSVPGWLNTLRAFQQHTIANRALRICGKAATSIEFYLQYFGLPAKHNSPLEGFPSKAKGRNEVRGGLPAKHNSPLERFPSEAKGRNEVRSEAKGRNEVRSEAKGRNEVRGGLQLIPIPPNIPTKHHSPLEGGGGGQLLKDYQTLLKMNEATPGLEHFPLPEGAAHPTPEGVGRGEWGIKGGLLPFVRIEKGKKLVAFSNRALPSVVAALGAIQKKSSTLKITWLGHAAPQAIAALENQCAGLGLKVRITGTQPLAVLAAEIEQADIVLLPQPLGINGEGGISLKNGTLAAAMAAGKAIIATRGDMTCTVLLQASNLLHLVADNETQTWQAAIGHLLKNEPHRRLLGQNARAFYEKHLAWEVVGLGFENFLTPGPSPMERGAPV